MLKVLNTNMNKKDERDKTKHLLVEKRNPFPNFATRWQKKSKVADLYFSGTSLATPSSGAILAMFFFDCFLQRSFAYCVFFVHP